MREQEFKARDKKVQKMTRDGLTEKNLTQGTEQRISQRLADVSFDRARPEEQAAGHRAQSRTQKKQQQQKQGAKPQDFQQPEEIDRFADATAPEVWGPENAPVSMRDAGDKPILSNRPPGEGGGQSKAKGKKQRPQMKKVQTAEPPAPEDSSTPELPEQKRLQFQSENPDTARKKPVQRGSRYQARFKPSEQPDTAPEDEVSPQTPEHGRLKFEHTESPPEPDERKRATAKKQAVRPASDTVTPDTAQESGRLRFSREEKPDTDPRTSMKKRQAVKFAADSAKPEGISRLRYDRSELPLEERAAADTQAETEHTTGQATVKSRQQKKYEKAQERVHNADRKLEKAQAKLPTRRRARLSQQYDSNSGKVKRRLQFETEVIPEHEKPPLIKRAGKTLGRATTTAAVLKAHQKIREVERDNVGVESAHKLEETAEAGGRVIQSARRSHKLKPYRKAAAAEHRLAKANVDALYHKSLRENPTSNPLSRWQQKRAIRKQYAAAKRTGQAATGTAKAAGGTARAAKTAVKRSEQTAGFLWRHKKGVLIAVGLFLIVCIFMNFMSSCSMMSQTLLSGLSGTTYPSTDEDSLAVEGEYVSKELALQNRINNTEADFPGYDEYRCATRSHTNTIPQD